MNAACVAIGRDLLGKEFGSLGSFFRRLPPVRLDANKPRIMKRSVRSLFSRMAVTNRELFRAILGTFAALSVLS